MKMEQIFPKFIFNKQKLTWMINNPLVLKEISADFLGDSFCRPFGAVYIVQCSS